MTKEAPVVQEKKIISKKIYASYGHEGEANWLLPLGFSFVKSIYAADVVVFGGGKDVDPGFYGEKRGYRTCLPSLRDKEERNDFLLVQNLRETGRDILCIGICRGHQLLTALSGGKLIQDVGNHSGNHSVSTFDKKAFKVNSIHHQMVFPYTMNRKDYKILAWTTNNISSKYLNGWDKEKWLPEGFKEIEIIYFPKTHSLGIQSHPEMMYGREEFKPTVEWMQNLFEKAYENKL